MPHTHIINKKMNKEKEIELLRKLIKEFLKKNNLKCIELETKNGEIILMESYSSN